MIGSPESSPVVWQPGVITPRTSKEDEARNCRRETWALERVALNFIRREFEDCHSRIQADVSGVGCLSEPAVPRSHNAASGKGFIKPVPEQHRILNGTA